MLLVQIYKFFGPAHGMVKFLGQGSGKKRKIICICLYRMGGKVVHEKRSLAPRRKNLEAAA